ncbi:hypothetical protein RJ640_029441, partial [Escallonia rubra]
MATAAKSALHSATTAATRYASGAKPIAVWVLIDLVIRSPVEMSCVTMLPFRTASALLTSMLSLTRRTYGSTLE